MNNIKLKNIPSIIYIVPLILILSMILFFNTWASMVGVWELSGTYTHGFFVIPASIWLIWQNKSLYPYLYPTHYSYLGLGFIVSNGFLWLLASITHVQVIQHFSLVGMLIGSFWFYAGDKTSKKLLFPLLFLYFMVPAGDSLLPYLMEFTADFTVAMLRLTGLSVYRENLHFTLTSGNWSVIEACSGLRYLIASITLGTIYAYITYTKTYKRAIFILFSIFTPIIANGLRAYMIVMIGHLSSMKLATGVDHLVYGALFFALIIFIMFYVGSFWADKPEEENIDPSAATKLATHYTIKQNSLIGLTLLISLGIWPLLNQYLQSHYHAQTNLPEWSVLTQNNAWQEIPTPNWEWQPELNNTANQSTRYFKKDNIILGLYQANFGDENQESELVNSGNKLISKEQREKWHVIQQNTYKSDALNITANISKIRNAQTEQNIITYQWYKIGNHQTNNDYLAKLYQLFKRLTLNTDAEIYTVLFLMTPKETTIDFDKILSRAPV